MNPNQNDINYEREYYDCVFWVTKWILIPFVIVMLAIEGR